MKLNSNKYCCSYFLILFFIMNAVFVCSASDEEDELQAISINVIEDIDLGKLISGTEKNNFAYDQIIKFEISSDSRKYIRVRKNSFESNDGIEIELEWKSGQYTGLESEFSEVIVSPANGVYYVTVKIKSVRINTYTQTGNYSFNPSITVEYYDI